MFVPTVSSVKRLCEDLLVALPKEPATAEEDWESGSLYVPHLSREDYTLAVRAFPHLAQVIREWRRSLPVEVERFLNLSLLRFYQMPGNLDCFPDLKTSEWGDSSNKPVFYYSQKTQRKMWANIKAKFLTEVELEREYLDLRLCAVAANQVALSLGRRGGVCGLKFAGYYPLKGNRFHLKEWQTTAATDLNHDRGLDGALESCRTELFDFLKIVVDPNLIRFKEDS